jgi:hypothetical protein
MSTVIDAALQGQVDAQLMEQGAYSALELLFNAGRLSYSDYEAWRRGELELLDTVLMGDPDKIRRQLGAAAGHARNIGLVEQAQEFFGWHTAAGSASRRLRISADAELERLIGARFAPAPDVPQMDLFFDNPVVALTNGIVRALTTHDSEAAQRSLDRLYTQAPNHADLAGFDRLLEALGHLHLVTGDARRELEFLLEVTPTAKRLLGAQARDLLSPLWRQLAAALAEHAFQEDEPALHRSFALTEAQDWPAVSASVLHEPEWWRHEALCQRLAHSCRQQPRRPEVLAAWCQLCWRVPQRATRWLDERQSDSKLTALWQRFGDDEDLPVEDSAIDVEWSAAEFPAWLLLHEPGLSQQLPEDLARDDSLGERHFRSVHQWLHARRTGDSPAEIELRRQLRASQPLLFAKLKRTL